jgi:hypothetical protein
MISESKTDRERRFWIIILGAGFSSPAGLPLANELFKEVRKRARAHFGSDNAIETELDYFVKYKRRCDGIDVPRDDVDYEEFLGFLDAEHALGFRGGDTITLEGNAAQLIVKKLIGILLQERSPRSVADIPSLYLQFAERLRPSDWVLTFNYDTLLESALTAVGRPFRLFPHRYAYVIPQSGYGVSDISQEEITVLKLHGSIDWFDKTPYDESVKAVGDPTYVPRWYSHFAPHSPYDLSPLLEGPQMPDDPMRNIYRMRDVGKYYSQAFVPQPPIILTPSVNKLLYFEPLKSLWWGIGMGGGLNLGMAIIGYSLPPNDEHARQAIYRLTDNYTRFEPDLTIGGVKKLPLRIVNLACGEERVRKFWASRYRFLDPKRAAVWLDGFNRDSLDFIFGERA